MKISQDLLNILVCPKDKASVVYDEKNECIRCDSHEFKIENEIPIMLLEE